MESTSRRVKDTGRILEKKNMIPDRPSVGNFSGRDRRYPFGRTVFIWWSSRRKKKKGTQFKRVGVENWDSEKSYKQKDRGKDLKKVGRVLTN